MPQQRIIVKGRVQGVAFRIQAQRTAQVLGLTGFVRNQPDGSVYIEAEGPSEALQQLIDWCRQGPPSAKVESTTVTEHAPTDHRGFEIRYD